MKALRKALGKGSGERKGPLTGKLLQISEQRVEVGPVLGEGGYGYVYRAQDLDADRPLALKHFNLGGDPEAARDVKTEVRVMKLLQSCPYVLRLHSMAFAGPPGAEVEAVLLLDLAVQTLPAFLQQHSYQLDDHTVLRIFLPVSRALQAMHSLSPPITHRDVKAENVLLHANGTWQLCDFGSASTRSGVYENAAEIAVEEEVIRKTTTPAYRAPELWDLWSRQPVGPPSDVWALGCLLYLLCFGQLPFDSQSKLQIVNAHYSLPETRSQGLRQLIQRMLVPEPLARANINEVVDLAQRLAAAEAPDLARPLPAAVQQAVEQQAAHKAQHGRSLSQDWGALASSRTPSVPGQASAAAPAAAFEPGGDDFAGWASFDSPNAKGQHAAAHSRGSGDAGPAAPAGGGGVFWERFGDQDSEPGPAPATAVQMPAAALPAATAASKSTGRLPAQPAWQPAHAPEPAAVIAAAGPLSAGAVNLQRRSVGSASVVSTGSAGGGRAASDAGGEAAPLSEVEELRATVVQLREHAQVLEELLEARTTELTELRAEVERLGRAGSASGSGGPGAGRQPGPRLSVTPPQQVDLNCGYTAAEAPTPTLAGGSRTNGSSSSQSGPPLTAGRPPTHAPPSDALRSKLNLGSSSSANNSGSNLAAAGIQRVSPSGWPAAHSLSSGSSTPSQGSPMRSRPSGRSSPTKGTHRRQLSAPQASMFSDLNPIGPTS